MSLGPGYSLCILENETTLFAIYSERQRPKFAARQRGKQLRPASGGRSHWIPRWNSNKILSPSAKHGTTIENSCNTRAVYRVSHTKLSTRFFSSIIRYTRDYSLFQRGHLWIAMNLVWKRSGRTTFEISKWPLFFFNRTVYFRPSGIVADIEMNYLVYFFFFILLFGDLGNVGVSSSFLENKRHFAITIYG